MIDVDPPPQDAAAELALLGSWLADPGIIPASRVDPMDFYVSAHQRLARAILGLADDDSPITPVTVMESAIRGLAYLEAVPVRDVVQAAASAVPHGVHAEHYARIVANFSRVRRLTFAMIEAQRACKQSSPDGLAIAEALREKIDAASAGAGCPLDGHVSAYVDAAVREIASRRETTSTESRLSWGVSDLDRAGVFIRPGDFPIVGARPGCGKTTWLRQWAFRTAHLTGRPVVYLTLEQDGGELVYDQIVSEAGIDDPLGRGLDNEQAENV